MDWKKWIRELGRDYFSAAAGPYLRGVTIAAAVVLFMLALFIVPTDLLILASVLFVIVYLTVNLPRKQ